jgi:NCAIR mutase (PurE)-related protein
MPPALIGVAVSAATAAALPATIASLIRRPCIASSWSLGFGARLEELRDGSWSGFPSAVSLE